MILMIFTSYFAALVSYIFEVDGGNQDFEIIDMLFWWVASMTTVGAGSVPITLGGKIFGMITMLTGAVVYLGLISEMILWIKNKSDEKLKGYKSYNGNGHILIIGYNELALGLINLLDRVVKPEIDIVMLTNSVETNPNPDRIHFVRKSPANSKTLDKVNVREAKLAFILRKDEVSDTKADLNTLLISSMIEKKEEGVYTFAEVSSKKQPKQLKELNVDELFTFEDLLTDIKEDQNESKILKKLPKKVLKEILL